MRPILAPLAGLIAVTTVLSATSGCEDPLTPPNFEFSFDGGVGGYDASAPPDASGPPPDTTLTVTPSALSNQPTATFEFTSTQPGTFACRLDGVIPIVCTSPHTVPVSEGVHTFEVSVVTPTSVDLSPATFTWMVDLTPPKTTISKAPPAIDNSIAVTFEFTATEAASFLCTLDDGVGAPCVSPLAFAGLAEGSHSVTIAATDQAGNAETPPATHAWTIDTSTPDTTITSGPANTVSAKTATFGFSSPNAGAGATFTCALDTTVFTPCTSPITKTALPDGVHTFRVKAADVAKNEDITPAERTWTVDSVPPTVQITGGPTGPISDTTPTFMFATGAGATSTQCRFDGGSFALCTSPFTPAVGLGQGAHTLTVRAFDAANNSADATRGFTVDTLAPSVTITPGAPGGPTGPTNDSTPTFTFTTAGGATSTECNFDGAGFGPCASPFTAKALTNAAHTFNVRAKDAAGNLSTIASRSFTVDTVAPIVTITAGPSDAASAPTNDTTPTFSFTTSEVSTTTCRIVPAPTFVPCTSTFTAAALADGPHTLEVRAVDAATNTSTKAHAFTIDTAKPSIVINTGPNGPTNDSTPTFTFTAGPDAVRTACGFDGAAPTTCTSPFTRAVALGEGAHTFEVQATDRAGNVGSSGLRSFTVDTIKPTIVISAKSPNGPTNDSTPTFDFTVTGATAPANPIQCRIDTGPPSACTTTYTPAALGNGNHTFTIVATDAASNQTTVNRPFSVDTVGPTITFTGVPPNPTTTPTFSFTATDVNPASPFTFQCQLDKGAFATCTSPWTPTGRAVQQGAHTITVQTADALGNVSAVSNAFFLDTVATVTITGLDGDTDGDPQKGPAGYLDTFTFTIEANSTAVCRIQNLATGALEREFDCTSVPSRTIFLPDEGSYQLEVDVTDALGNEDSGYLNFTTYIVIT